MKYESNYIRYMIEKEKKTDNKYATDISSSAKFSICGFECILAGYECKDRCEMDRIGKEIHDMNRGKITILKNIRKIE